ncbi:uncharacterized protein EV420DRAFT_1635883 [Desarmillaria tabescens]|uniref:C2H2-type domain-containing protein n=1 Tax=Armillaria tabescens TaxID=1929756 RepID=A0AA39TYL1_ARMTA|nr:uncharacterized protein EV420DRAFT_1635883 [Desarmillaria tabescens]KAK0466844.1 hypothetical protein EV420DRAFT_1635883 [Desarmillaria tabescens]
MSSSKRPRTSVSPTVSPSSSSPEPEPTHKALRTAASAGHPLLCTLPPTCSHKPTPIANSKDLETHYATYHAHVCEEPGCSCVFPEARLLELNAMTLLAAIRKERGDKIFACHLTTCPKVFQTPKARRLHLINAHGFPKEYFFAVTNKGVGGLLKKWGEGASMIRGEWKKKEGNDDEEEEGNDTQSDTGTAEEIKIEEPSHEHDPRAGEKSEDLDALADSMTSLSLVPNSIRFGRGGKGGGFPHSHTHPHHASPDSTDGRTRTRGRGGRRGKRAMSRYAPGGGGQEGGAAMDVDSGPSVGRRGFPRGINRGFVPRARARGLAPPLHTVSRGGPGIIMRGRGGAGTGFV